MTAIRLDNRSPLLSSLQKSPAARIHEVRSLQCYHFREIIANKEINKCDTSCEKGSMMEGDAAIPPQCHHRVASAQTDKEAVMPRDVTAPQNAASPRLWQHHSPPSPFHVVVAKSDTWRSNNIIHRTYRAHWLVPARTHASFYSTRGFAEPTRTPEASQPIYFSHRALCQKKQQQHTHTNHISHQIGVVCITARAIKAVCWRVLKKREKKNTEEKYPSFIFHIAELHHSIL